MTNPSKPRDMLHCPNCPNCGLGMCQLTHKPNIRTKTHYHCEPESTPSSSPLQEKILERFRKVRTDAITEMFENKDEVGIYPTSKFFKVLDQFISEVIAEVYETGVVDCLRYKGEEMVGISSSKSGMSELLEALSKNL